MHGIEVDGARPAVARVTALPRRYGLNAADRLVLMALACDSYDGETSAPGYDALAEWTGMLRSSVAEVLRRLTQPIDGVRPALIERAATKRGRDRTTWRLLLQPSGDADLLITPSEPSGDTDWFELEPSGEPSGDARRLPSPNPGGTNAPEESAIEGGVAKTDERPQHPHEPNARRALQAIIGERRLPSSVEELLAASYALGHGNPWDGYKRVSEATARSLTGMENPRAAIAKRLSDAGLTDATLLARLRRRAA